MNIPCLFSFLTNTINFENKIGSPFREHLKKRTPISNLQFILKDSRPAPMSVYNGILRSYFLLGTKISFASNNDEKIVDHIYMFSYYP